MEKAKKVISEGLQSPRSAQEFYKIGHTSGQLSVPRECLSLGGRGGVINPGNKLFEVLSVALEKVLGGPLNGVFRFARNFHAGLIMFRLETMILSQNASYEGICLEAAPSRQFVADAISRFMALTLMIYAFDTKIGSCVLEYFCFYEN